MTSAVPLSSSKQLVLLVLALMALTILSGFPVWWSFLVIAFAGAYTFSKRDLNLWPAAVAPPAAWVMSALVRDIFEDGRISAKLAPLLHVRFSAVLYVVLFLIVFLPSALATYSGHQTAKALK